MVGGILALAWKWLVPHYSCRQTTLVPHWPVGWPAARQAAPSLQQPGPSPPPRLCLGLAGLQGSQGWLGSHYPHYRQKSQSHIVITGQGQIRQTTTLNWRLGPNYVTFCLPIHSSWSYLVKLCTGANPTGTFISHDNRAIALKLSILLLIIDYWLNHFVKTCTLNMTKNLLWLTLCFYQCHSWSGLVGFPLLTVDLTPRSWECHLYYSQLRV